jgi:hypothetical protein
MSSEKLAQAERHVDSARLIVNRQEGLIARQKVGGHSTIASEGLLETFQQTLAIFEIDLEALKNRAKA